MPKGFSHEEKNIIREKLLLKGKELFEKYGYKKLGIRDLSASVGIANGMFYKFFESKEELFYTIINNEKRMIRDKIKKELFQQKDDPVKAIKSFYYLVIEELNKNPMMKTILLKDEYSFITRKITEEQLQEEREKSFEPILQIAEYWKEKGYIKDINMELVFGSIRSLILLWFHKEEIGEESYPQVIEFMLDRICEHIKL